MSAIEIKNIHKSFGEDEILKGISLEVEKGQTIAILGPSGSGKTTFLRSINFLEPADKGTIKIGDKVVDVEQATKQDILDIRRKTSMVFQQYALFANKTALENITEGLIIPRKMDKNQADKIAQDLLARVGLADYADYYPAQLSGGQQQRIGIARALAVNPDIILFDEPTSALDPEKVGEVLNIIKEVADQGITMIIVTHEISFAYDVADKILFMEAGVVVEEGSPEKVLKNSKEPRTRKFLQQTRFIE